MITMLRAAFALTPTFQGEFVGEASQIWSDLEACSQTQPNVGEKVSIELVYTHGRLGQAVIVDGKLQGIELWSSFDTTAEEVATRCQGRRGCFDYTWEVLEAERHKALAHELAHAWSHSKPNGLMEAGAEWLARCAVSKHPKSPIWSQLRPTVEPMRTALGDWTAQAVPDDLAAAYEASFRLADAINKESSIDTLLHAQTMEQLAQGVRPTNACLADYLAGLVDESVDCLDGDVGFTP